MIAKKTSTVATKEGGMEMAVSEKISHERMRSRKGLATELGATTALDKRHEVLGGTNEGVGELQN